MEAVPVAAAGPVPAETQREAGVERAPGRSPPIPRTCWAPPKYN